MSNDLATKANMIPFAGSVSLFLFVFLILFVMNIRGGSTWRGGVGSASRFWVALFGILL